MGAGINAEPMPASSEADQRQLPPSQPVPGGEVEGAPPWNLRYGLDQFSHLAEVLRSADRRQLIPVRWRRWSPTSLAAG
ncbi:hypothetical protein DSL92_01315 [Billgrantia gudaonensis]|uniref:Uncharacterized protein n=1 Tax=Billgrantia gudaonensis TaxID=376427 RepID=A0A3S0NEI4_9GAMM|nr:hypothetical protein DSL92_01315 [Halomonas gudaonensis]